MCILTVGGGDSGAVREQSETTPLMVNTIVPDALVNKLLQRADTESVKSDQSVAGLAGKGI